MGKLTGLLIPVIMVAAASLGQAQTLNIPQIADGGGWQTTLVLTNETSSPGTVSLKFYQEIPGQGGASQPWNLSFIEGAPPSSIAPGQTVYLHTLGAGTVTNTGWGAATVGGVNVYAIFTQRVPGRQDQDGTAPGTQPDSRFLAPFDETNNAAVGVAIANSANATTSISVAVMTSDGKTTTGTFNMPPNGHYSFNLGDPNSPLGSAIASAVLGKSGTAEFYTANPVLSMITLRFNNTNSFTAAPVYSASGAPILGSPVNGGSTSPFSTLIAEGVWNTGLLGGTVLITVVPDASGGTYTAEVVQQSPSLFAIFTGGTLKGQTLSFSAVTGAAGGSTKITAGMLALTVNDFNLIGSAFTGTMSITAGGTTNGTIAGNSSYLP